MKNTLLNLLYSFCIITLLVFSVIAYHNSNILESRINSLNKNSIDFNSEKTFKEDYYIKQLDRDTNLLLVVFPLLVGFASLFTFANVVQKLGATKTEIENKIKEKETEWEEQHKRLNSLEIDLNFQVAGDCLDSAKKYRNESDFKKALMLSLKAMEKYSQILKISNNNDYNTDIYNLLSSVITYNFELLKDIDTSFEIEGILYTTYNKRIITILEVLNKEDSIKFNSIISKYKIV